MKANGYVCAALLGASALIAGCAGAPVAPTMVSTNLMVGDSAMTGPMENVNAALQDQTKLRGRLRAMSVKPTPPNPPKLKTLIDDILAEHTPIAPLPALSGLGGSYGWALIKAAEGKVGANDDFDPGKSSDVALTGEIVEYSYNPANKSGRLVVETTQSISGGTPTEYVWEVEVLPQGFQEIGRTRNPSDPFPGTLAFDAAMLQRIVDKNFRVKLWAKGGKIKIKSVKENGALLPAGHPFLRTDPQNCIDMMFDADPGNVPTTIGDLGETAYCLGRCAMPALINTP